MNKLIPIIVGAVIVVGGGAFIITRDSDDGNKVTVTNSATGKSTKVATGESAIINVDACEVLTDGIAQQILGAAAKKGDTSAGNASSESVSVSNCVYTLRPETGTIVEKSANTRGVAILARSAKDKTGGESNKAQFGPAKPAGVEDVSGIGDAAFWNPKFGQLNVLKGNNYYIVSSYKGRATQGTLEMAKELARLVTFK